MSKERLRRWTADHRGPRSQFLLSIEDTPEPPKGHRPSVEIRLRQLLKLALRTFGLRVKEIRQSDASQTAEADQP